MEQHLQGQHLEEAATFVVLICKFQFCLLCYPAVHQRASQKPDLSHQGSTKTLMCLSPAADIFPLLEAMCSKWLQKQELPMLKLSWSKSHYYEHLISKVKGWTRFCWDASISTQNSRCLWGFHVTEGRVSNFWQKNTLEDSEWTIQRLCILAWSISFWYKANI